MTRGELIGYYEDYLKRLESYCRFLRREFMGQATVKRKAIKGEIADIKLTIRMIKIQQS